MAREAYSVTPLSDLSLASVNRLIAELNAVLERLTSDVSRSGGQDGNRLALSSDLDMRGHRIINLGAASKKSHAARFDQVPQLSSESDD